MEDNGEKSHFFEKMFLLANISIDIAMEMPFFTLNNFKIDLLVNTSTVKCTSLLKYFQ